MSTAAATLASMQEEDGSEDVNDFLRRIRELDDRRNREDEERTRKLQEELLKGRQEREARRAERARSLSPTKESPSQTPVSLRSSQYHSPAPSNNFIRPVDLSLSSSKATHDYSTASVIKTLQTPSPRATAPEFSPGPSENSGEAADWSKIPKHSPSAAIAPSKAPTLSWQRRPGSSQNRPRPARPLSAITFSNTSARNLLTSIPAASNDLSCVSRAEITESLESKDPAWFQQTEDRGKGSPAYVKDHAPSNMDSVYSWTKTRLPAVASSVAVPGQGTDTGSSSARSESRSRASLALKNEDMPSSKSTNSSVSGWTGPESKSATSDARLPLRGRPGPEVTSHLRSHSQHDLSTADRSFAMSPSQGRIAPERLERSASPTKGIGGFVQSAMLKRSDSFQKRSGGAPFLTRAARERAIFGKTDLGSVPDLNRPATAASGDPVRSVDAARAYHDENAQVAAAPDPSVVRRHTEPQPGSEQPEQPYRHSMAVLPSFDDHSEAPTEPCGQGLELQGDSQSQLTGGSQGQQGRKHISLPLVASKTGDSKRWSPTKASWLESALSKASEPVVYKARQEEPPSWLVDARRRKQLDASQPSKPDRASQEIKTAGLMRAAPLGMPARVSSPASSTRTGPTAGQVDIGRAEKLRDIVPAPKLDEGSGPKGDAGHNYGGAAVRKSTTITAAPVETPSVTASNTAKDVVPQSQTATPESASSIKPSPGGRAETTSLTHRIKPATPPKKDLSAVLKPRPAAGNSVQPPPPQQQQEEPEFKNIFGKLRHTKTQKYVAHDELKDNILRGKASLHATSGPVKQERKDELKESILRQKETMSKAKSNADEKWSAPPPPPDAKNAASKPEEERQQAGTPEAIARRRLLSKSVSSGSGSARSSVAAEPATPEALLKLKVIKDGSKASLPPVSATAQLPSVRSTAAAAGPMASAFNQRLATFIARGPQSSPSSSAVVTGSGTGLQSEKAASSDSVAASAGAETHHETGEAARPLTHLTKGRAKGPKRRPPQSMAG